MCRHQTYIWMHMQHTRPSDDFTYPFCLSPQVTRADSGDVSVAFAGDRDPAVTLDGARLGPQSICHTHQSDRRAQGHIDEASGCWDSAEPYSSWFVLLVTSGDPR
jgi:hypothetical protein